VNEPAEGSRDYLADMNAQIEAATQGSGWVAAIVAEKLHAALLETDLDLLDGWLHAMAVDTLRRYIGLRDQRERAMARSQAGRRSFAEAAARLNEAEGSDDRQAAAAILLGLFTAPHVIDQIGTRKRALDMTGPDHLFVAGAYENEANASLMLAEFHRAIAKKAGDKRTADVMTADEYERLYLSIVRRTA
jgi:hypothetical protein